uniref:Uncharacterized protein n=1 Tax=Arundo donax TaxID=35708 RepID=A0A0A9HL90_ARUDO
MMLVRIYTQDVGTSQSCVSLLDYSISNFLGDVVIKALTCYWSYLKMFYLKDNHFLKTSMLPKI